MVGDIIADSRATSPGIRTYHAYQTNQIQQRYKRHR